MVGWCQAQKELHLSYFSDNKGYACFHWVDSVINSIQLKVFVRAKSQIFVDVFMIMCHNILLFDAICFPSHPVLPSVSMLS